jgi:hypothetical protein
MAILRSGGAVDKNHVQTVAEAITKKFGLYECRQCADELEREFLRIGVSGAFLTLEAISARPYILMKDSNFKLPWRGSADETITRNGFHYGIRIGNTVFDNIFRSGIEFSEWQRSFDCAGSIRLKKERKLGEPEGHPEE